MLEKISIDVTVDHDKSGNIRILNTTVSTQNIQTGHASQKYKLKESDVRYSILTLGVHSPLAQYLHPAGSTISVEYDGVVYTGRIHSSAPCRIDGLSKMYHAGTAKGQLHVQDNIIVSYDTTRSVFIITA